MIVAVIVVKCKEKETTKTGKLEREESARVRQRRVEFINYPDFRLLTTNVATSNHNLVQSLNK